MLQARFLETNFATRYQRNNKKNSLKNLRCFPSCTTLEHREKGFCGRSVVIEVINLEPNKNYYSFAEFMNFEDTVPRGSLSEGCEPLFISVGDNITLNQALQRCRTKINPGLPWLPGIEGIDGNRGLFEFNKDRRGWHYGWQSNKHTCDTLHCFRIYLFSQAKVCQQAPNQNYPSQNSLICEHILDSSKFMLFCRRRRRFYTTTPSASSSFPSKSVLNNPQISTNSSTNQVKVAENYLKYDYLFKDLLLNSRKIKYNDLLSSHSASQNMSLTFNSRSFKKIVFDNQRDIFLNDLSVFLMKNKQFQNFIQKSLGFNFFTANLSYLYSSESMLSSVKNIKYKLVINEFIKVLESYKTLRKLSSSEIDILFKNFNSKQQMMKRNIKRDTEQMPDEKYDINMYKAEKKRMNLDLNLSGNSGTKRKLFSFENVAKMISSNFDNQDQISCSSGYNSVDRNVGIKTEIASISNDSHLSFLDSDLEDFSPDISYGYGSTFQMSHSNKKSKSDELNDLRTVDEILDNINFSF